MDPRFARSSDIEFYLRLAGEHKFTRVPEALVDRRYHLGNLSADYRLRYQAHERLIDVATDRYEFLDDSDIRRKRARMAYRRSTSALAAADAVDAARYALHSYGHGDGFGVRSGLVLALAILEGASGPLSLGRRLYHLYDRRRGGTTYVQYR